jgi:hypothetical protein
MERRESVTEEVLNGQKEVGDLGFGVTVLEEVGSWIEYCTQAE